MKPLFNLSFFLLIVFSFSTSAQNFDTANIVRNGEGPAFVRNHIIIKFNPIFIDTALINDPTLIVTNVGNVLVEDSLNAYADGWDETPFNQALLELKVYKIFPTLSSWETYSVSRLGNAVPVPAFWSVLLVEWEDSLESQIGFDFGAALDTLNKMPGVIEYAIPNYVIKLASNDPLYNYNSSFPGISHQPNLHSNPLITNPITAAHINIEPAWALSNGYSQNPVRVGVYDSGVNFRHEDLSEDGSGDWEKSRVVGGFDFYNTENLEGQTIPDHNGHGTWIAGIIGGIRNNGTGIAGVAGGDADNSQWGADIVNMKITNNFGADWDWELSFLTTASRAIFEGTSQYNLDVMNFSWYVDEKNTPHGIEILRDVIAHAFRNNVSIAVAAGNDGTSWTRYPASYRDDFLMKVGATGINGERVYFSNTGNNLDFMAPGHGMGNITIDYLSNTTYSLFNGTSSACPHVTGVAALMISYIRNQGNAVPNQLAPEDIEQLLKRTSKHALTGYTTNEGWGLINAGAALESIEAPAYEVKHYVETFSYNKATLIRPDARIKVGYLVTTDINTGAILPVPRGKYTGDVYKITEDINISQSSPRGVIDVWPLSSLSSMYTGYIEDPGPNEVYTFGDAGENAVLESWNQSSANISGYIYHLKKDELGQDIDLWIPENARGLAGTGRLALAAYTVSPWSSGVKDSDKPDNKFSVAPNPNNGNFSISMSVLEATEVTIDILDLAGRIVQTPVNTKQYQGEIGYKITADNLKPGVYFCRLIANAHTSIQKIMITE